MAKKPGFTHESAYNESKEWFTPKSLFNALGLEFDLDTASPGAQVVPWIPAKRHLTIAEDGLKSQWGGRTYTNPPYGMDTPMWVKKFVEHGNGVMLVFSRTDTRWFHDYASKADAMLFIDGRMQFIPYAKAEECRDGVLRKKPGEKLGRSSAASLLLACDTVCVEALRRSGLGLFVPLKTQSLSGLFQ